MPYRLRRISFHLRWIQYSLSADFIFVQLTAKQLHFCIRKNFTRAPHELHHPKSVFCRRAVACCRRNHNPSVSLSLASSLYTKEPFFYSTICVSNVSAFHSSQTNFTTERSFHARSAFHDCDSNHFVLISNSLNSQYPSQAVKPRRKVSGNSSLVTVNSLPPVITVMLLLPNLTTHSISSSGIEYVSK